MKPPTELIMRVTEYTYKHVGPMRHLVRKSEGGATQTVHEFIRRHDALAMVDELNNAFKQGALAAADYATLRVLEQANEQRTAETRRNQDRGRIEGSNS